MVFIFGCNGHRNLLAESINAEAFFLPSGVKMCSCRLFLGVGITLAIVIAVQPCHAQEDGVFAVRSGSIKHSANGVLALMSYSVIPDLTTSSLSITDQNTGNPDLSMTQVAGGFTVGEEMPLYLEGGIAASRYDPTFVVTNGTEERILPTKWNSLTGSVGIGWDFPILDELKFRPIANFALGRVSSDLSVAKSLIEFRTGHDIDFLNNGYLDAVGYGGALMLDYEHYRAAYEIDVELRYSAIHLQSYGDSSEAVKGHARSQTANLWARWRAPTGLRILRRPFRYVLELTHSEFFGDQRGVLGFTNLTSLGAGLEFETSSYPVVVSRLRLVGRYVFGDHVSGSSVGLAVSF